MTNLSADTVDGVHAARVDYRAQSNGPNPSFTQFYSQGGLTLRGRCIDQSGTYIQIQAKTSVQHAEIQVANVRAVVAPEHRIDRDFNTGDTLNVFDSTTSQAEGTLTYSTPAGDHVSITYQGDEGLPLGGLKDCLFAGTALYAPAP